MKHSKVQNTKKMSRINNNYYMINSPKRDFFSLYTQSYRLLLHHSDPFIALVKPPAPAPAAQKSSSSS